MAHSIRQVLKGEPVSTASDVYSTGVVAFEIMSREDPYEDEENLTDLVRDIMKRKRRPIVPVSCPAEVQRNPRC